jgi:UDP-galactopyranose mutase
MALREAEVTFVGRLATYRYYNMDQCVGAALKASEKILARLRPEGGDPLDLGRTEANAAGSAASRRAAGA